MSGDIFWLKKFTQIPHRGSIVPDTKAEKKFINKVNNKQLGFAWKEKKSYFTTEEKFLWNFFIIKMVWVSSENFELKLICVMLPQRQMSILNSHKFEAVYFKQS